MEDQIQQYQIALQAIKEQRNAAFDEVVDFKTALHRANQLIASLQNELEELKTEKEVTDELSK